MGANNSTGLSFGTSAPAQEAWDTEVARIFHQYDVQGGGNFGRQQVVDQATTLGAKEVRLIVLHSFSYMCIYIYTCSLVL